MVTPVIIIIMDVMGTTTRADTIRRYFLLFFTAILGILLLTHSCTRLRAGMTYLPVETALRNHWNIRSIDHTRFPGLIEAAEKSITTHKDSRYWHGLAWMNYLYGVSLGYHTNEAKESFTQAQKAFEARLQSSPSEPADWLRLGWVHVLLGHPAVQVIDAWKMSVYTGRAEHYLLLDRLEQGLRYADDFKDDDRDLLCDQLLLSWKYQKNKMRKKIRDQTFALHTIRGLLFERAPEIVAEIETVYEKNH